MNKHFFLKVISDFINGIRTEPILNVDWTEILSFAKKHQVVGIIYYQCKDFIDDQLIKNELKQQYLTTIYNSTNYENNYNGVKNELTRIGIPFVPVKGFTIAQLYPMPELRTMGDIDILVNKKDFPAVTEMFFHRGFCHGKKTEHEITFRKNQYYYEIHELMLNNSAPEDEDKRRFYNNYWSHLSTDANCGEQKLEWSFYFMFLLQHMRQHILWEGIGFRQFMDMGVVIKQNSLDWEYITESAKHIELSKFMTVVITLIDNWFGIKAPIKKADLNKETIEYITNKVFDDGVFGFCSEENRINVFEYKYRKSTKSLWLLKIQNIFDTLFPPYGSLYNLSQYSFLKGRPYLLPMAWIYRIFDAIKNKKYVQVKQMKRIATVNKSMLDKRKADIEMWGL